LKSIRQTVIPNKFIINMTQTLSQRVIQLNNEAITCALKGFRQDGVMTLQTALAMVVSIQDNKVAVPRSNGAVRMASSVPLSKNQCSKPFDDVFQFFNRAITIPADDERFANLSCPHARTQVQATILYNLGVLCHMEAVCSGSSAIAFSHALQFYAGAYQVIETSSRVYGLPHNDTILLILALFNNMGHIHSGFMMDSDKTRQCVSWMQATFAASPAQQVLTPEDYSFFSQYISVPANAQLMISPAA
jgi:hypothetical protein